jgi:hypothetical protein
MAFDRNDPAQLQQLSDEVRLDPIGMGYAAQLTNTAQLLKLLNDPANNVGGETAQRDFTVDALLDALEPSDLSAGPTVAGAGDWVSYLVAWGSAGNSIASYRTKFRTIFNVNSTTVQALDAQTKPLSRAEVLWGEGTVITRQDWGAASNL